MAPNGGDPVMGTRLAASERKFTAIVYRRYTRNFRKAWPNTAESGDNDGMPGPTIRAEVGDTVIVHFRNPDHHYGLPHPCTSTRSSTCRPATGRSSRSAAPAAATCRWARAGPTACGR